MVTDLVLTDIRAGYRVLTLNRPDRLNSFSADLHAALMAALPRPNRTNPAAR